MRLIGHIVIAAALVVSAFGGLVVAYYILHAMFRGIG